MKLKLMRYELFRKHAELVKQGEFEVARLILEFLRKKRIALDLSDVANEVERILERIGFRINYSHRYFMATAVYAVA